LSKPPEVDNVPGYKNGSFATSREQIREDIDGIEEDDGYIFATELRIGNVDRWV